MIAFLPSNYSSLSETLQEPQSDRVLSPFSLNSDRATPEVNPIVRDDGFLKPIQTLQLFILSTFQTKTIPTYSPIHFDTAYRPNIFL